MYTRQHQYQSTDFQFAKPGKNLKCQLDNFKKSQKTQPDEQVHRRPKEFRSSRLGFRLSWYNLCPGSWRWISTRRFRTNANWCMSGWETLRNCSKFQTTGSRIPGDIRLRKTGRGLMKRRPSRIWFGHQSRCSGCCLECGWPDWYNCIPQSACLGSTSWDKGPVCTLWRWCRQSKRIRSVHTCPSPLRQS